MAQKKQKVNPVLLVVGGIAVVVSLVLLYIVFFSGPDVDVESLGATQARSTIKTDFPTELFDDTRINQLKQYGPAEVQVSQRGVKQNPFEPF